LWPGAGQSASKACPDLFYGECAWKVAFARLVNTDRRWRLRRYVCKPWWNYLPWAGCGAYVCSGRHRRFISCRTSTFLWGRRPISGITLHYSTEAAPGDKARATSFDIHCGCQPVTCGLTDPLVFPSRRSMHINAAVENFRCRVRGSRSAQPSIDARSDGVTPKGAGGLKNFTRQPPL